MFEELSKYKKIAVAISGGVDSTVLLYDLVTKFGGKRVVGIHADYGQATATDELAILDTVAEDTGTVIETTHINLPSAVVDGSPDAQIFTGKGKKPTAKNLRDHILRDRGYVPGLFTIVWATIGAQAINMGCKAVAFGFHSPEQFGPEHKSLRFDDFEGDCGEGFVGILDQIGRVVWGPDAPKLHSPYTQLTKMGVYRRGLDLGLEELLVRTNSCDCKTPCGVCSECVTRRGALNVRRG